MLDVLRREWNLTTEQTYEEDQNRPVDARTQIEEEHKSNASDDIFEVVETVDQNFLVREASSRMEVETDSSARSNRDCGQEHGFEVTQRPSKWQSVEQSLMLEIEIIAVSWPKLA